MGTFIDTEVLKQKIAEEIDQESLAEKSAEVSIKAPVEIPAEVSARLAACDEIIAQAAASKADYEAKAALISDGAAHILQQQADLAKLTDELAAEKSRLRNIAAKFMESI